MPTLALLDEARRLIRFNTVTTRSNAECAYAAGRLLHRHGCQVQYQEWREGTQVFLNVIGLLGAGSAPPLLLASHLDTVEPGDPALWTKTGGDPWRATVRGDRLYGLGAADDKLDFLCKVAAAAQVPAARLTRPLMILGTFGEERGLLGAARFCQGSLPKPGLALVGEPSELQLVTQHKGLLVGELSLLRQGIYHTDTASTVSAVEVLGRAAHSSTPALGENAVGRLLAVLAGAAAAAGGLKVLRLDGGTAANIIPASATALVTAAPAAQRALASARGVRVRAQRLPAGWHPTVPWQDAAAYARRLEPLFASYRRARAAAFAPPSLTATVTQLRTHHGVLQMTFDVRSLPSQDLEAIGRRCERLGWTLFGPPGDRWQFRRERQNPSLTVGLSAPVVRLMRRAMRRARVPVATAAKSGCSEAGWYQMVGIPSVVFGPGRAHGNIHRPNECNSLRQIRRAIAVYRAAIELACTR